MAERNLPGLGLRGYWPAGTDGWGDENDVNLRMLSALVECAPISRVTTLPGSPTNGDIYIVPTGGDANKIAIRDEGAWVYIVPTEGFIAWVKDENALVGYTGSAWAQLAPSGVTANGASLITAANYAAMKTLLAVAAADISDASANGRSLITAADYAAMRTALSLVVGTNVQAYSAELALPSNRVLWQLIGCNMNDNTLDQAFTKLGTFTNFLITEIRAVNASISLTTATGGIYTAAAEGGDALVGSTQVYSTLSTTTRGLILTKTVLANGKRSDTNIYFNGNANQAAAATCDIYILGQPL